MRNTAVLSVLLIGYILDLLIGDPENLWHPVRGVGWWISTWERILRKHLPATRRGERVGGCLLVLLVLLCSLLPAMAVLSLAYRLHFFAGLAVESILCAQMLASKSLRDESMRVARALEDGLPAGRQAVSRIVGRDTRNLDEAGVIRAAVETVAENTSDGVIAPMLFIALGGGLGGLFYKTVNTMDSMVGYRNAQYRYFGTAAARLDDLCNFIPARVSALLMIAASAILHMDAENAVRIFQRDRLAHASPNSAQTEAVMAGALDVQLAGDASYFGELHHKPTIGDPIRPVERADIARANRLMYLTGFLGVLLCAGCRLLAAVL